MYPLEQVKVLIYVILLQGQWTMSCRGGVSCRTRQLPMLTRFCWSSRWNDRLWTSVQLPGAFSCLLNSKNYTSLRHLPIMEPMHAVTAKSLKTPSCKVSGVGWLHKGGDADDTAQKTPVLYCLEMCAEPDSTCNTSKAVSKPCDICMFCSTCN